ncbi:hypothetical protein Tco_1198311 [Tanacetum coccineum]
MACSVPHTYDEIKSMVEKQIQEDRGRQLTIMNLGHQFDNAITAKDEMRKAYEECRDILLVQRALTNFFLKIESELDQQMQNALFRFMYSVDENLAIRHMDYNLNIFSLTPAASSEGVWCFAFGENLMILLWNPSIKKSVGISVPNYTFQPDSPKMIFGFGIHPVTLEPTLLKINYPLYSDGPWFYNDDGISYKIYLIVSVDLVTHQFHVQDMPQQVRVGEFSPPYYTSQLGDSLIISGSFDFGDFRIIYAWALEVEGGLVSSCSLLFTIPLKLLGFSKDNQPIVEATIVQQWYRSLQVFHPTIQYFQNIGVEANRDSFFIGPFKESLILLTEPNNEIIY